MIIAKIEKLDHIFTGPELQPQIQNIGCEVSNDDLTCPICGRPVTYNDSMTDDPFEFFEHSDGSTDCFETKATSEEHRLMIEIAVKSLHNRIREVTGETVEIDIERWIGIRENFVIADVRVTSPLRVAAELFYKSGTLALGRRFGTMFSNDYRTYLIFHVNGCHNIDRVEQHLQQVAPLRVGRFDPETLDLTLGDMFTNSQFKLTTSERELLPDYIAR